MSVQNWPEVLETADRLLDINADCSLALMVRKYIYLI